jgi:hypothetical protein
MEDGWVCASGWQRPQWEWHGRTTGGAAHWRVERTATGSRTSAPVDHKRAAVTTSTPGEQWPRAHLASNRSFRLSSGQSEKRETRLGADSSRAYLLKRLTDTQFTESTEDMIVLQFFSRLFAETVDRYPIYGVHWRYDSFMSPLTDPRTDRGPLQLRRHCREGIVANNINRPFLIVRSRFTQMQGTVALF